MGEAKTYIQKQVRVSAIQFRNWGDAIDIRAFGANVFYVPKGAEHHERRPNEFDRGNGHVLDEAPCFLVFGEDDERVDYGDWIIRTETGDYQRVTSDVFTMKFIGGDGS